MKERGFFDHEWIMYQVTTKSGQVIVVNDETSLNSVLKKLGSNFRSCVRLRKSYIGSNTAYSIKFKKVDLERFGIRAKALGFKTLAAYIKMLMNVDYDYEILMRGEDFIGNSKYQFGEFK